MKQILSICLISVVLQASADTRTAPDFTLAAVSGESGERVQLASLQAELIYLDFWASWCGPCKISFPDMTALQEEFGARGLKVVAISVDDRRQDVEKFLRRFPVNFTVLHDTDGQVAAAYELPAMPTSFLIDGTGEIRYVHVGYKPGDVESLRQHIAELLNESP